MSDTSRIIWYLFIALMIFMGFYFGMSAYAIHDNNEGLYAEIAREMLVSGQYIIPHLDGVPYIEKPPLLYWLILLSYKAFGVTTFAARLVPSLCGTLVCISCLWFAHMLKQTRTGMITAIMLASSIGFVIIGRIIFFDMLLTFTLTTSLLLFYLWHQQNKSHYLILSYVFLAFAFLSKGLVGVAFAATIALTFMIIYGSWRQKLLAFFNPYGLILFFVITGTWLVLACKNLPQFAWDFFINENWYRFLGKRIPMDYYHGPVYYYLPRLFIYLCPWLFLAPILFGKIKRPFEPFKLFMCLWFFIPFLIFSFGNDKGNYYMIISTPPLALLIAQHIDRWIEHNRQSWLNLLFVSYALIILIAVWGAYFSPDLFPIMKFFTAILAIGTTVGIIISSLAIWHYRKAWLTFFLIALLILPVLIFGMRLLMARDDIDSQVNLVAYIKTHHPDRPVYLYKDYEEISTTLYFMQHPLPIIDSVSRDLYFGSHTDEATPYFIDRQSFMNEAKAHLVYVVMKRTGGNRKLNMFTTEMTPLKFCIVTHSEHAYLITNDMSECGS